MVHYTRAKWFKENQIPEEELILIHKSGSQYESTEVFVTTDQPSKVYTRTIYETMALDTSIVREEWEILIRP